MDIRGVFFLHGPNVRARVPVLEAAVDCRKWTEQTNEVLAECDRRLAAWLPGLRARRADRGRFVRTDDSSCMTTAALLCDSVLELQAVSGKRRVAGVRLDQGWVEPTDEPGVCRIVAQFEEEALARACLITACRFFRSVSNDEPFDAADELERLRELAWRVCLGFTNAPIVAAARERGIPWCRLDDGNLVQLGHGVRRRRIMPAVTDRTCAIAEAISSDKEGTKRLLRELGIPVPAGRTAATAEEAWAAACEIGLPVVVKPRDADYGRGVGLNLTTREQVVAAAVAAGKYGEEFVVEQFVEGDQFRLTVIGGRVVAAVRRDPVRLVGDGRNTVAELIDAANLDPRRGPAADCPLELICPDNDTPVVLAEQGLDLDAVPPAGALVTLSRIAHTWAGAGVTDVTDQVHPETAAQVVSAVRLIGLDIAGVDLIARDIALGLDEQGGVVVEVNAQPALSLHYQPFCPVLRPIGASIVESLFPPGETGRIPLTVVTGGGDNGAIGRQLVRLLRAGGRAGGGRTAGGRIGRASSEGLFLNERRFKSGCQDSLAGNRALLLSPEVEAAVMERSLASIRREGLGLEECDVAVVSRIGDGPATTNTMTADSAMPDSLAAHSVRAARVLIESVSQAGAVVLDADDPALPALLDFASATTILVATRADHPSIRTGGRRAVFPRGGEIVLRDCLGTERGIAMRGLRTSGFDGRASSPALLMAVAAAWAARVPVRCIEEELGRIGSG